MSDIQSFTTIVWFIVALSAPYVQHHKKEPIKMAKNALITAFLECEFVCYPILCTTFTNRRCILATKATQHAQHGHGHDELLVSLAVTLRPKQKGRPIWPNRCEEYDSFHTF